MGHLFVILSQKFCLDEFRLTVGFPSLFLSNFASTIGCYYIQKEKLEKVQKAVTFIFLQFL
jgi:hypothetical protein